MRRVGQVRKRDGNEAAIVDALRRVGAFVMRASIEGGPDLLVLWRGTVLLVECKATTGTPTPAQQQTAQEGWPIATVRSPQDALAILGVRAV